MNQERFEMLKKYALQAGISIDELIAQLDALEQKGKLGFGYLKKLATSQLLNQTDARSLFRMTAQEGSFSSSDEYLETFPNLPPFNYANTIRKFQNYVITRNRLQHRNIMITPEMWHTLVENQKVSITSNFFKKTVDPIRGQIMFSQLFMLPNLEVLDSSISHRKDCYGLILRTIQFDFLNSSSDYEDGKSIKFKEADLENMAKNYDLFIKCADQTAINNIYDIAEKCFDFSIHEYYLPYGFSLSGLNKAVLLMRYDHCRDKHKNSVLPKFYDKVYTPSVVQPHFHFNEGFGQIYKMLTKNGQGNFGSGFAIGLPDLIAYLNDLKALDTLPKQDQKLLSNNDFGMPFLSIFAEACKSGSTEKITALTDLAVDMCLGNFIGEVKLELQQAFDFFNSMDGIPAANLETFDVISNQKNYKNDQERER